MNSGLSKFPRKRENVCHENWKNILQKHTSEAPRRKDLMWAVNSQYLALQRSLDEEALQCRISKMGLEEMERMKHALKSDLWLEAQWLNFVTRDYAA